MVSYVTPLLQPGISLVALSHGSLVGTLYEKKGFMRLSVLSALIALSSLWSVSSASAEDACIAMPPTMFALRSDGVMGSSYSMQGGWSGMFDADPSSPCYYDPTNVIINMCEGVLSRYGRVHSQGDQSSTVGLLTSQLEEQNRQLDAQGSEILRLVKENKRLRSRLRQRR
jgi:hypothetical protein